MALGLVAGCSAEPVEVRYGQWSVDDFRDFEEDPRAQFRWWGDCAFFPAVVVSMHVVGLEPEEAKGATLDAEFEIEGLAPNWERWGTMQLEDHRLRLERASDGTLKDEIAFATEDADPALGRPAVFRAFVTFPDGTAHEVEHEIEILDAFDYGG
jgi:hypothetical protein